VKEQTQNKRRWGILGRWEFWAGAARYHLCHCSFRPHNNKPPGHTGHGGLRLPRRVFYQRGRRGAGAYTGAPSAGTVCSGGHHEAAYRPQHTGAAQWWGLYAVPVRRWGQLPSTSPAAAPCPRRPMPRKAGGGAPTTGW